MSRPFFLSSEIWIEANIINEIIKDICSKIDEKNFGISKYTNNLDSIAIIVNCHPKKNIVNGWGKPRKYINYSKKYADIRLPIPFDEFVSSDYDKQYLMVVDNIIKSLKIIEEKCKKSKRAEFDSESIIKDILKRLEITMDRFDGINGVLSDDEYEKIRQS